MTGRQNASDVELDLLADARDEADEAELRRTYQRRLLKALDKNNLRKFNLLLLSRYVTVDEIVDSETCLTIAIKRGRSNFVNSILLAGADCNKIVDNLAPLHLAIKCRNIEIVERLLRESKIDVNLTRKIRNVMLETPLIFLIREAAAAAADDAGGAFFVACAKELLLNEAMPNIKNNRNYSAIMVAVEERRRDLVCAIVDYSQINVEIDRHVFESGRSVRDVINEERLYTSVMLPPAERTDDVNELFSSLRKNETETFVERLGRIASDDGDFRDRYYALLRFAIKMTSERALDALLRRSDEIDPFALDNKKQLIDRACWRGNVNVLASLLGHFEIQPEIMSSVAVKYIKSGGEHDEATRRCVNFLLQHEKMPVNEQDVEGNTILYHVIRRMDDVAVRLCLRNGASLAVKNRLNEFLLDSLDVRLFEEHLDDCVSRRNVRGNDVVEMNFSCLDPIGANGEMDLLRFVQKSDEHRHLLEHPLLETFVIMKCQRLHYVFYVYLLFYALFCAVVFVNSYVAFCPLDANETLARLARGSLYAYAPLLLIIELSQLQDIDHYIKTVDNLLDVLIIVCCVFILFHEPNAEYFALTNVLAVLRLIFHLGKFRYCSTYISMFKTVASSFIKFISWSSVLLLAFSWSFFITLRDDGQTARDRNASADGGADRPVSFFNTWPGAFFKSFVMLTGEFSIEDINFKSYISYVLLLMFIFIVSIVFFNLLNGLAVSDIQMIESDAKLYGLMSLTNEISFHEDLFLAWNRIARKIVRNTRFENECDHLLAKIDIFPDYLPEKRIYILPNLKAKIITRLDRPDIPCNISLPKKLIRSIIEKTKKHRDEKSKQA